MTNNINNSKITNINNSAKNSEIIQQKAQMFSDLISKISLAPISVMPKILTEAFDEITNSYTRCSHSRNHAKFGGSGFGRSYTKCTAHEI